MSNESPFVAPGNDAGIPAAPPQPIKPNRGLSVAMMVLSAVYVALCLVEIFALAHRASLADQILNDPTSVSLDQADSADSLVHGLSIVAIVVFLATLIVMGVWQRSVRKTFGPTGQYQTVLKESGFQFFRIVWLITLGLSFFLRGSEDLTTPQEVVSHDHKFMFYFGLRAALGLLLIYLAVRLSRVVQRNLTLAQAGYSQAAVDYLSS